MLGFDDLATVAFPQKDNYLATQEERIKGLETHTGNIRERLARIESKFEPAPKNPTHPLVTGVIGVACLAVLWYWGWIGTQIVEHGKRISEINILLSPQRLTQAAETPTSKESIAAAKQILATAKQKNVPIPSNVVKEAGEKFIEASERTPDAWPVVLRLVSYRSELNAGSVPSIGPLRHASLDDEYQILLHIRDAFNPGPPDTEQNAPATAWLAGNAPAATSAKAEYFTNPPRSGSSGAQFIIIDWRRPEIRFGLDEVYLKNVIIKNAVVDYAGGPIKLDNVYFVNCTFEFGPTLPARDLGSQLLASASVTFSKPS